MPPVPAGILTTQQRLMVPARALRFELMIGNLLGAGLFEC